MPNGTSTLAITLPPRHRIRDTLNGSRPLLRQVCPDGVGHRDPRSDLLRVRGAPRPLCRRKRRV